MEFYQLVALAFGIFTTFFVGFGLVMKNREKKELGCCKTGVLDDHGEQVSCSRTD